MRTLFGNYDYLMVVYPVYVFYEQWPFCLVAMAKLVQKEAWKEDPGAHQQG